MSISIIHFYSECSQRLAIWQQDENKRKAKDKKKKQLKFAKPSASPALPAAAGAVSSMTVTSAAAYKPIADKPRKKK